MRRLDRPLSRELGCLRIQKALNLQTISRHSFTDSKIVKLLSLGDHGAEERRAHASANVARDIKKSRPIALLLPHQTSRRDRRKRHNRKRLP